MEEALAQIEGSSLADMFDFLSKELIRLQVTRDIMLQLSNLMKLYLHETYTIHMGLHRCDVKNCTFFIVSFPSNRLRRAVLRGMLSFLLLWLLL